MGLPQSRLGYGVLTRALSERGHGLQLSQVHHGAHTKLCAWLGPAPPPPGSLGGCGSGVQEPFSLLGLAGEK